MMIDVINIVTNKLSPKVIRFHQFCKQLARGYDEDDDKEDDNNNNNSNNKRTSSNRSRTSTTAGSRRIPHWIVYHPRIALNDEHAATLAQAFAMRTTRRQEQQEQQKKKNMMMMTTTSSSSSSSSRTRSSSMGGAGPNATTAMIHKVQLMIGPRLSIRGAELLMDFMESVSSTELILVNDCCTTGGIVGGYSSCIEKRLGSSITRRTRRSSGGTRKKQTITTTAPPHPNPHIWDVFFRAIGENALIQTVCLQKVYVFSTSLSQLLLLNGIDIVLDQCVLIPISSSGTHTTNSILSSTYCKQQDQQTNDQTRPISSPSRQSKTSSVVHSSTQTHQYQNKTITAATTSKRDLYNRFGKVKHIRLNRVDESMSLAVLQTIRGYQHPMDITIMESILSSKLMEIVLSDLVRYHGPSSMLQKLDMQGSRQMFALSPNTLPFLDDDMPGTHSNILQVLLEALLPTNGSCNSSNNNTDNNNSNGSASSSSSSRFRLSLFEGIYQSHTPCRFVLAKRGQYWDISIWDKTLLPHFTLIEYLMNHSTHVEFIFHFKTQAIADTYAFAISTGLAHHQSPMYTATTATAAAATTTTTSTTTTTATTIALKELSVQFRHCPMHRDAVESMFISLQNNFSLSSLQKLSIATHDKMPGVLGRIGRRIVSISTLVQLHLQLNFDTTEYYDLVRGLQKNHSLHYVSLKNYRDLTEWDRYYRCVPRDPTSSSNKTSMTRNQSYLERNFRNFFLCNKVQSYLERNYQNSLLLESQKNPWSVASSRKSSTNLMKKDRHANGKVSSPMVPILLYKMMHPPVGFSLGWTPKATTSLPPPSPTPAIGLSMAYQAILANIPTIVAYQTRM